MSSSIGKSYQRDCLLVVTALAKNDIKKNTLKAAKRLTRVVDHPIAKILYTAVHFRITKAALGSGLYFRSSQPLAVISGAGIAGLAASFELRARGFRVAIIEKRAHFSRFNVINLNVATRFFLKKFNLLEKFEEFVGARIKEHMYVLLDKSGSPQGLALSHVRESQPDASVSFESRNLSKLFKEDAIYSVPIEALQKFLVEHALKTGVNVFGDVTVQILSRTQAGGISKAKIPATFERILKPALFLIAEGTHSTTARELGIGTKKVENVCTGELWVFGNMTYSGNKTFVVSMIDASTTSNLRIANVIFNAKHGIINVAVTSEKRVTEEKIREQIIRTAHQVFHQNAFPIGTMSSELLTTVRKPVCVANRTAFPFAMGNVFCIGDSAGSSSPLAGLGGTLGLTLVPRAVEQLADDYERQPKSMHDHFTKISTGYTDTWIRKSARIKNLYIKIFDQQRSSS